MNKRNWFAIVGVCALAFVTGCSSKSTDNGNTDIGAEDITGETEDANRPVSREENDRQPEEEIEQVLADYRSDRAKGESDTPDGYVLAVAPNEEDYGFGVGDTSYTSRFDTKEVSEAFKAAEKYLEDTLKIKSPLYCCADPRMTAIYDEEDKGVANRYEADNIFLCEYSENDEWKYIILVREGKGEEWSVLFHGNTYKQ